MLLKPTLFQLTQYLKAQWYNEYVNCNFINPDRGRKLDIDYLSHFISLDMDHVFAFYSKIYFTLQQLTLHTALVTMKNLLWKNNKFSI